MRAEVKSTEASKPASIPTFGRIDEWHLLVSNSVCHFAFGFVSRLDEDSISLGMPFSSSRFVTIGSIGDAMDDDGIE